ncbi:Globin [Nymphon striatum]|nr:Globin [Nymphon striatum]
MGSGEANFDISIKEIEKIQESWALVRKDIRNNGMEFFLTLFRAHPEYQEHFPAFKNIPLPELKQSGKFRGHATTVMYSVSSCVGSLEDPELIETLVDKIGQNHFTRGVTTEMFTNLMTVLVGFLQEALGSEVMDDETTGAWKKLGAYFVKVVGVGLNKAKENC